MQGQLEPLQDVPGDLHIRMHYAALAHPLLRATSNSATLGCGGAFTQGWNGRDSPRHPSLCSTHPGSLSQPAAHLPMTLSDAGIAISLSPPSASRWRRHQMTPHHHGPPCRHPTQPLARRRRSCHKRCVISGLKIRLEHIERQTLIGSPRKSR